MYFSVLISYGKSLIGFKVHTSFYKCHCPMALITMFDYGSWVMLYLQISYEVGFIPISNCCGSVNISSPNVTISFIKAFTHFTT